MGYLVPTLCMLQEKLRDKRDLANSCRPLVEALLAGISRRFAVIIDDAELIASAILHPKFKRDWTDDAPMLEKGMRYITRQLAAEETTPVPVVVDEEEDDDGFFNRTKIVPTGSVPTE